VSPVHSSVQVLAVSRASNCALTFEARKLLLMSLLQGKEIRVRPK
jgi:hypothetical protein